MTVLALDLATDRLSVAARSTDGREAEAHLSGARNHARGLVPLLETVLAEVGSAVSSVDRVIVADGPGSFTGLRVAAALAKGLAATGGCTMAAAPSLLGRATRAGGGSDRLVLAAASALRGEVYAGWYRFGADASVSTARPAIALDWAGVLNGPRPDLIVGDAPDGMLEALGAHWQVSVATREGSHADARALLRLDRTPGGTTEVPAPEAWEPVYGRPAEAQARWERDHGRPLEAPPSRSL